MKLAFKTLFFSSLASFTMLPIANSRDVILVENRASNQEGQLLLKILTKKFNIPEELITLKNINSFCEKKTEAIIHLCLQEDGELNVFKMNRFVVQNSLGAFINKTEKNGDGSDDK